MLVGGEKADAPARKTPHRIPKFVKNKSPLPGIPYGSRNLGPQRVFPKRLRIDLGIATI